jgi:hypothetical protein
MSHKTFIAAIIGLIVVAAIALTMLSSSRDTVGGTPEPAVGEVSGEVVAPEDNETVTEPAPGTSAQGKINVQVACESALMYTTFTDGAAADAFVAECVEGKHPDVIERYIESLGVDGATI